MNRLFVVSFRSSLACVAVALMPAAVFAGSFDANVDIFSASTTATAPRDPNSDITSIINAVIGHSDFGAFGVSRGDNDDAAFVLLSNHVPRGARLEHPKKKVVVLSEAECLREMITAFFEIEALDVDGDTATVRYAYPEGAHFGTIVLQRREGVWQVTEKRGLRSSSGGRTRLAKFRARIPSHRLADSGFRPQDRAECQAGVPDACYRTAVVEHNAGRLEKAEALYDKACLSNDVQACHNLAMLLVKTGRRSDGLLRLEGLCKTRRVQLSCSMLEKYGK